MYLLKRNWFFHVLQVILVSLISGWILYQSFSPNSTLVVSLAVIAIMFIPFIFLWQEFSKKTLIAILFLTVSFNIDQTLFLREHHCGAMGLIVSVNGLVIILLYIIHIIEAFNKGNSNFQFFKPVVFPLIGLGLMAIISLINAPDRMFGLYEWLELIKMMAIFLYITHMIAHEDKLEYIITILLIGVVIESVIGMIQFATGSTLNLAVLGGHADVAMQQTSEASLSRIGGTLGGANAFAWYLDFILPIPLALVLTGREKRNVLLNISALCLGCVVLFMTYSRGGWLSMLISGFIILAYIIKKITPVKRFYTILIMVIIACIGIILIVGITNPVRDRFMKDDKGSAFVRIPLMQVAVNMIRHNPIIGVGLNNYTLVDQNYDQTPGKVSVYFPYPVHNIFLQLAAEVGLIGFLFFIIFLILIYFKAISVVHSQDPLVSAVGLGLFASLIGAMIQAQVENATIGSVHLLPLWMLSGVVAGLWEREKNSIPKSKFGEKL